MQFNLSAFKLNGIELASYAYCSFHNSEAQYTHLAVPSEKRRHAWA